MAVYRLLQKLGRLFQTCVSNLRQVMQDYGADYNKKEDKTGKVLATAVRNENGKIVYTLH